MEKTLREALREYELVFMPSRNWAAKTRVNYRNDIADLLRFLEKRGNMAAPTSPYQGKTGARS
jgi:site-specific recombinase XerD